MSELPGLASLHAGAGVDKHANTPKDLVAPTEHPTLEDCHAKLDHLRLVDRDQSGLVSQQEPDRIVTGINASPEQKTCTRIQVNMNSPHEQQ